MSPRELGAEPPREGGQAQVDIVCRRRRRPGDSREKEGCVCLGPQTPRLRAGQEGWNKG